MAAGVQRVGDGFGAVMVAVWPGPTCGRCGGGLRLHEVLRILTWAWACDGCGLCWSPLALVDDERFFVEAWEEPKGGRRPRPGGQGRRVNGRATG